MKPRNTALAMTLGILSWLTAGTASADFINGNFQTGDFTGWTRSAIDAGNSPISPAPFINIGTSGANYFAQFTTGQFADGLFVATLEQSVLIEAAKPFLSFDFSLPTLSSDPTGAGTSPFLDSLTVSLDNGTSTFTLLLVDKNGALADPFGTAPGTVALGTPLDPVFDFGFRVDTTSLAGQTVRFFIDITNENDGSVTTWDPDNHLFSTAPPAGQPTVPEPSSLVLLSLGGISLLVASARSRKWSSRPLVA